MERQKLIEEITSRILAITLPHPVRVAIDGVDAAGKTILADEIAQMAEASGRAVIRASIDGFHNPSSIRHSRGDTSPEGYFHDSFNCAALIEVLLRPLGPGGSLQFRRTVFDFRKDEIVETSREEARKDAILIFDGVFLLREELRPYFDFSVFVQADFTITAARAEQLDVHLFGSIEEVRRRYRERYIPGQQLYLAEVHPEQWASVVVNNNYPTKPVFERVP